VELLASIPWRRADEMSRRQAEIKGEGAAPSLAASCAAGGSDGDGASGAESAGVGGIRIARPGKKEEGRRGSILLFGILKFPYCP
jgi:hypothetical protein